MLMHIAAAGVVGGALVVVLGSRRSADRLMAAKLLEEDEEAPRTEGLGRPKIGRGRAGAWALGAALFLIARFVLGFADHRRSQARTSQ